MTCTREPRQPRKLAKVSDLFLRLTFCGLDINGYEEDDGDADGTDNINAHQRAKALKQKSLVKGKATNLNSDYEGDE